MVRKKLWTDWPKQMECNGVGMLEEEYKYVLRALDFKLVGRGRGRPKKIRKIQMT